MDQNRTEFKQLIVKIRAELNKDSTLATQYNFELVEALCKMRIDSLNLLMREMISSKKLSRNTKDITVQMLYFANLLKNHHYAGDSEIVFQLLRELQFL